MGNGLTPDPSEAERWLRRELSEPIYQPSPFERVREFLGRLFDRLSEGAHGLTALGLVSWLALFLFVALGVALLLSRLRPARRAGSAAQPVLGSGAPESSAVHRSRALAALHAGDTAEAVREATRAMARSLTERGLAEVLPGATAREVADLAIAGFPEYAERLHRATVAFDRTAYGGWRPDHDVAREAIALDEELRHRTAATGPGAVALTVPR